MIGDERIHHIRQGRSPGAMSVPLVLPGLVDCGVRPEGYVAGPVTGTTVRSPEEAFVSLCLAYGVTSVVDVGSSWETSQWFQRHGGINYLAGGPRICRRAASRSDIEVSDNEVNDVAEWLVSAGSGFISLEREVNSTLGETVPRAVSRDRDGVTLPGLEIERRGGTWWAPQLLARQLWSVEGLAARGDCTEARAFLPYLENFAGEQNFIAKRAARHVLNRMYGSRPALDAVNEPEGMLPCEQGILASSAAGWPGVIPGRSLWEEMGLLEMAYGADTALCAATGNAYRAFPELNAGKLTPGSRFDALLVEAPTWSISNARHHVQEIVVGGCRRSMNEVQEDVQRRTQLSDERKV